MYYDVGMMVTMNLPECQVDRKGTERGMNYVLLDNSIGPTI